MSKPASSPTARLLQSSRLFSLPRPLPRQPELSSGIYRSSDTATAPHPTHQAIVTTASSHFRGDWGLKRTIPKKRRGETNSRAIRINAQDTTTQITDFGGAGDHVQTAQKWAEMEVPFVFNLDKDKNSRLSVFERGVDTTDPAEGDRGLATRWKFEGPWLGGMSGGDFDTFLHRKVESKGRRKEWMEFLRKEKTEQRLKEARARDQEAAFDKGRDQVAKVDFESQPITDDELRDIEKQLRDDHDGISSELTGLICKFFDLPSVYEKPGPKEFIPGLKIQVDDNVNTGPPTTHYAAGLSHLRTASIMYNHPYFGPQESKPPVESRVVRPRRVAGAPLLQRASLGVGGVVAIDQTTASYKGYNAGPQSSHDEQMVAGLRDIEGGNKLWVRPETAFMTANSRIQLNVSRASEQARAIKQGDGEKLQEHLDRQTPSAATMRARSVMPGGGFRSTVAPRVRGFDSVLRTSDRPVPGL